MEGTAPHGARDERSGRPEAAASPQATEPQENQAQAPAGGLTLADVRRLWPDIVEATKLKRRVTWIHLTQNAQVVAVDQRTLTLGFNNAGARESFVGGGSPEIVRQAAIDVIGADWNVEAIVDPGAQPGVGPAGGASSAGAPAAAPSPSPAPTDTPASPAPDPAGPSASTGSAPGADQAQPGPSAAGPAPEATASGAGAAGGDVPPQAAPEAPPPWAVEDDSAAAPAAGGAAPEAAARPTSSPGAVNAAREAITTTRPSEQPRARGNQAADADAHPDDPALEDSGLAGTELLQRELGAQIIQEIKHD